MWHHTNARDNNVDNYAVVISPIAVPFSVDKVTVKDVESDPFLTTQNSATRSLSSTVYSSSSKKTLLPSKSEYFKNINYH